MPSLTEQQVWDLLRQIPDPEIPTINLVDLGIVHRIAIGDPLRVEIVPTFVGCPALEFMRREIAARLAPFGNVEVKVVFDQVWTTDRITPAGRAMLKQAGLAPPPTGTVLDIEAAEQAVTCPYCDSTDTLRDNLFGPTPCRSIHYCRSCRQPFEQFKAV